MFWRKKPISNIFDSYSPEGKPQPCISFIDSLRMREHSAKNLSVVLEKEFIKCTWCGTRYTQKMISELKSMCCIKCGGSL